jgi:hypothetical protein
MKKISVIITGATGMVGEGVLVQCLHHDQIDKVLSISRKPVGYSHPKLKELIVSDLSKVSTPADALTTYHACFFCAGTSPLGKSEAEYTAGTYALTVSFAAHLATINPQMTFCYVSGAGSDSTEKGRLMWTRVKGKTENALLQIPFDRVYNFRAPVLVPFLPLRTSQTSYTTYRYLKWIMELLKPVFPNLIIDLRVLAQAMINSALKGYPENILEAKDIKTLAEL